MMNSLIMILGRIKGRKIDYQERFLAVQTYSTSQLASVLRGSAYNENLESLQADWKRKTISHCDSISSGKKEFMVDGLLAVIGIGVVLLIRSSPLATGLPVLTCTGIAPVALGFVE